MTVPQLEVTHRLDIRLSRSIRWWDSDAGCTLVISQPSAEPRLWTDYLDGARRSYRKHGVECALDLDAMRSGADTALLFAALDETGRVVGGFRAKGPHQFADESHAMLEWAGHAGQPAVRKMIADRLPFGVVEMKAAWVDDPRQNGSLITTLARIGTHAMQVLDLQFIMATSAAHVLDRWRSSGGVVASAIPAAPYPDERYQTQLMWWDRRTYLNHAEPRQVSKILTERTEVSKILVEPTEQACVSHRVSQIGARHKGR